MAGTTALAVIGRSGKERPESVARLAARKLYYCDLTVDCNEATYAPFIRLALARYQPHTLVNAKLSRVVLADFAQLTPERALMVTSDPYVPGVVQAVVSGPAPRGPLPHVEYPHGLGGGPGRPTKITVSVQVRDTAMNSDLAWSAAADFAVIQTAGASADDADFILWSGSVRYAGSDALEAGRYRLLITEEELYEADGAGRSDKTSSSELGSSMRRPCRSTSHFSPRPPTPSAPQRSHRRSPRVSRATRVCDPSNVPTSSPSSRSTAKGTPARSTPMGAGGPAQGLRLP